MCQHQQHHQTMRVCVCARCVHQRVCVCLCVCKRKGAASKRSDRGHCLGHKCYMIAFFLHLSPAEQNDHSYQNTALSFPIFFKVTSLDHAESIERKNCSVQSHTLNSLDINFTLGQPFDPVHGPDVRAVKHIPGRPIRKTSIGCICSSSDQQW